MTRFTGQAPAEIDPNAEIREVARGVNDGFRVSNLMIENIAVELNRLEDATKISPPSVGVPFLFGDGSDDDLHITSGTTNLGDSDHIKQYRNLTIDSGATLASNATSGLGYHIIYVSEAFYNAGTLAFQRGWPGGVNGGNAADHTTSYGGTGGGGGAGGVDGGDGGDNALLSGGANGVSAGGNGGNGNAMTDALIARIRYEVNIKDSWVISMGTGSGPAQNTCPNGVAGGGVLLIFANSFVNATGGLIHADGNDGVDGTGNCGGSGGGGGGLVAIISRSLVNDGTIRAAGGVKGDGAGTGGNGGTGGVGTVILEAMP